MFCEKTSDSSKKKQGYLVIIQPPVILRSVITEYTRQATGKTMFSHTGIAEAQTKSKNVRVEPQSQKIAYQWYQEKELKHDGNTHSAV